MTRVDIHDANIDTILYSPSGGVARECNFQAHTNLLPIMQAALSRPWPGPPGPFPPVGPPYLRTGELRDSLRVIDAVGPYGPETNIVPTAIHRGVNYGLVLRARGYRFLPDYFYV
jgi:hypothetical protein